MLNSLNEQKIIAEKFGGYHKMPYICSGNIAKTTYNNLSLCHN